MISKINEERYNGRYFKVHIYNNIISNIELIGNGYSFGAQNFEEMAAELRELRKMIWPGYNDATTQTHTMRVP